MYIASYQATYVSTSYVYADRVLVKKVVIMFTRTLDLE